MEILNAYEVKEVILVPQEIIWTVDGIEKEIEEMEKDIVTNQAQIVHLQNCIIEHQAKKTEIELLGVVSQSEVAEPIVETL